VELRTTIEWNAAMNTIAMSMNLATDIQQTVSEYKNQVLLSPRPGSIKDYSRLAIMIACSYQSAKDRHRDASEDRLLRSVYLQRLKEISRLYPCQTLRPRGFENIENLAYIESTLAQCTTLPVLIRNIVIEQFPEIPLHHVFAGGCTLNEELDRIISDIIETYVPAYGGSIPACTADNYTAVA
jgi:phosphoribosylpyrophosphate synthetase